MLISTGSRLFRFLLSLIVRLRRSFGHIALALRARFASLWRSILTFARPRDQPKIRLHANDDPVVNNNPMGGRPQISESEKVEEEGSGNPAALPVRGIAYWQNELSKYQALTLSHEFKDPHPATPEGGSRRYEPRRLKQSVEPPDIPAGQKTLLSALPLLPDGWTRHVHPEGNVLFYHKGLHIFTESDIFEHGNDILFYATRLVQQAMQNSDVILDELTEIVLNVDGSGRWHYYFVDHSNRLLFWVHSVNPQDLGTDLRGGIWLRHITGMLPVVSQNIAYDMESRTHCEYYPHNRTLPRGIFEDLRGMLNYAKTDMITTDSSSSPFAHDELVAILDLVNSLKDDKNISDPYNTWVIARLMTYFIETQFLSFCGQTCARLNADTPLFGQQTWNRSIVFRIINLFLLTSPNEHAVRLQRVWVDGIIIQPRWKDFVNRLTAELGRYPIFSTVMLAVNFSFLAVPGVVTSGSPASSIEIIIYCSVVSTIGSVVFSFALSNVYSDPRLMDADPAAEVMKTLSRKKWGMACLAITHSLPVACLIWSITLFSAALAIQIFGPKERSTITTLGVECLILVLFGVMSGIIMGLFSRSDDVDDVDTFAGNDPPSSRPQLDVELGWAKCCTFYGR